MGSRTRGGLTRAAYRAARSTKADRNAQPPLTREQHAEGRAKIAAELAAAPKPTHNTIHGTHTGPKDVGRGLITAPVVSGYRIEREVKSETDSTGRTRRVTIEHRVALTAAAVVGASVVGKLAQNADDGAKPYSNRPSVPVGKGARYDRHKVNKKMGRPNRARSS